MRETAREEERRVRLGVSLETELPKVLEELGARRVLIVAPPSMRFVDRVIAALGDRPHEIAALAQVHVPAESVSEASRRLEAFGADTVISIGGGSATGLGKALCLSHDVKLVAIPTTYSGSEQTNIYGTTAGAVKTTGRDDRARPSAVIYDAELSLHLPKKHSVQSLTNALAHSVSALSTGRLALEAKRDALETARRVFLAIEALVKAPDLREARVQALGATARAGAVIDAHPLGVHHQLAHFVGGRFGLDHAALHAVLLLHTLRALADEDPELYLELESAVGVPDLPGALFDLLRRAGAELSIMGLGVELSAFEAALEERPELPAPRLRAAYHGGWPSVRVRAEDWGGVFVRRAGPELSQARVVVIALHGRGSNAYDFTRRVFELVGDAPDVAVVAPQASGNRWYEKKYSASAAELEPELSAALHVLDRVVARVTELVSPDRVYLFGFSQGACLASEWFARTKQPLAGLLAFAGARIGPVGEQPKPGRDMAGAQVLLGAGALDPWLVPGDVERTAACFRQAGAMVTVLDAPGDAHLISGVQRIFARAALLGRSAVQTQSGFSNTHESEALPGALPKGQNSPRHLAYGLYAEQLNETGFTHRRAENRRTWMYRIRPAAGQDRFVPLSHARFNTDFEQSAPEPNLLGWSPLRIPETPTDFVDGLATFGGAGSPSLRRGFAVHLYAANRSMEDRSFSNADGELLIVPERGRLLFMTELGVLELDPGQIAIIPRGLRFSVMLREDCARGFVAEVYGRSFTLPERGPVGANGLTDPRHFRAPVAWFENRIAPGYRLSSKFMGQLYDSTQDYSPFDVVAWHGNAVPYVYDLCDFSPVGNVRMDHGDPSIHTVLSAPLDEPGAHCLDFVFFPPRFDVTRGTFRPPFFHRNAVTEFNGIIRNRGGEGTPFAPGSYFLTPSMTPHGVRVGAVERELERTDREAEPPLQFEADSMWFQFETTLPVSLSAWALTADNRVEAWHQLWGAYRTHYRPPGPPGRPPR